MKIRYGFVSNSSSSSFLIVGTTDDRLIDKILSAKNLTREEVEQDLSFGFYDGGDIEFLGSETLCYAGVSIDEEEMNLKPLIVIKQQFADKLKQKYRIVVPVEKIGLHYGEVSSG
jgi:hypothetical protein